MSVAEAPDQLLSAAEVAEKTGFHPETVRRWIRRRELAAVRVGGKTLRIRLSDLEAFLQRQAY